MVLVKTLMKITFPKMGELFVMTAVTIFPSLRKVSPAEQLRRSPRLVPPRFRLETAAFCPESLHIAEYGHRRATRGPTR